MKFTCLQESLAQKLTLVNRTCAPKSTLSILSNVRMVVGKDKLKLSATNLQWSVTTTLGVEVAQEGGITVPGVLLSGFVNNLPPQKLIFQTHKDSLKVETAQGWATLRGVGTEDFPPILEEGASPAVMLESAKLRQALSGVTFAAAVDESRPILTGVLLRFLAGTVKLVGVDGFRLAEYTLGLSESFPEELSLVLPSRSLAELNRLLSSEKQVRFSLAEDRSQAIFEVGETVLSSRLLEGDFPQYDKIIPQDFSTVATIPLSEFRQAIKVSSLFTEGSTNVIRLQLKPELGQVLVGADAKEIGANEMGISSQVTGDDNLIAFNGKYLNDILIFLEELVGGAKDAQLELRVKDAVSPGYLCHPDHPEYLHIIMPVRIQE